MVWDWIPRNSDLIFSLLGEHLVQVEFGKDDGTLMNLMFGSPDEPSEQRRS